MMKPSNLGQRKDIAKCFKCHCFGFQAVLYSTTGEFCMYGNS